jgi:hypothetical protein
MAVNPTQDIPARVLAHFAAHPLAVVVLKRKRGKTTALANQIVEDLISKTPLPPVVYAMGRTLEAARLVLESVRRRTLEVGLPVGQSQLMRMLVNVRGTMVPVEARVPSTVRGIAERPWIYVDEAMFVPYQDLVSLMASYPPVFRCIGSPKSIPADTFADSFKLNVGCDHSDYAAFDAHVRAHYPWVLNFPLLIVPE